MGVHRWELPPQTSGRGQPDLEAPRPLCSGPRAVEASPRTPERKPGVRVHSWPHSSAGNSESGWAGGSAWWERAGVGPWQSPALSSVGHGHRAADLSPGSSTWSPGEHEDRQTWAPRPYTRPHPRSRLACILSMCSCTAGAASPQCRQTDKGTLGGGQGSQARLVKAPASLSDPSLGLRMASVHSRCSLMWVQGEVNVREHRRDRA